jgi:hypothetical protein
VIGWEKLPWPDWQLGYLHRELSLARRVQKPPQSLARGKQKWDPFIRSLARAVCARVRCSLAAYRRQSDRIRAPTPSPPRLLFIFFIRPSAAHPLEQAGHVCMFHERSPELQPWASVIFPLRRPGTYVSLFSFLFFFFFIFLFLIIFVVLFYFLFFISLFLLCVFSFLFSFTIYFFFYYIIFSFFFIFSLFSSIYFCYLFYVSCRFFSFWFLFYIFIFLFIVLFSYLFFCGIWH